MAWKLVLLMLFVLLLIGYVLWAALRAARSVVKSGNKLRTLLAALLFFMVPCMASALLLGGAVAALLTIAHLAMFLFVEQLLYSLVMRIRKRRVARQSLRDILLCKNAYASPSRLHRSGLVGLLCVALLFAHGYANMRNIVRTQYSVETQCSIPNGTYRLALVSDLHFGAVCREDELRALTQELNAQDVDLLVLCGDIVDESTSLEEMQCAFALLGSVNARDGVFYVRGNHDRASYRAQPSFTLAELDAAVRAADITLLEDERTELHEGLFLVGREDRSHSRMPIAALLEGVPEQDFVLLLDHQPVEMKQNAASGVDLMLSGHTHGGQFFPLGYINTLISRNELCYGLERIGDMTAIVSSGVSGWGIPLRTQSQSEYVIVNIYQTP